MDQTEQKSRRSVQPKWSRILAGAGTVIVIVTGVCIAVVPDWEICHANTPAGNGLKLTGVTALVVGVGVVIWGIVFLFVVIYPDSKVWSRRLFIRSTAKGSPPTPSASRHNVSDDEKDQI